MEWRSYQVNKKSYLGIWTTFFEYSKWTTIFHWLSSINYSHWWNMSHSLIRKKKKNYLDERKRKKERYWQITNRNRSEKETLIHLATVTRRRRRRWRRKVRSRFGLDIPNQFFAVLYVVILSLESIRRRRRFSFKSTFDLQIKRNRKNYFSDISGWIYKFQSKTNQQMEMMIKASLFLARLNIVSKFLLFSSSSWLLLYNYSHWCLFREKKNSFSTFFFIFNFCMNISTERFFLGYFNRLTVSLEIIEDQWKFF